MATCKGDLMDTVCMGELCWSASGFSADAVSGHVYVACCGHDIIITDRHIPTGQHAATAFTQSSKNVFLHCKVIP